MSLDSKSTVRQLRNLEKLNYCKMSDGEVQPDTGSKGNEKAEKHVVEPLQGASGYDESQGASTLTIGSHAKAF